jgi:hypothetical protein
VISRAGMALATGGLTLDARINGPQNSLIKPTIADQNNGTYTLCFSTVTKGFYEVIVCLSWLGLGVMDGWSFCSCFGWFFVYDWIFYYTCLFFCILHVHLPHLQVFVDNVKLPVFRFVVVGAIDVDVSKCKATGT